jgi:hypothetical protein
MAILDSQGRLFGKVSILDIGAALVILLVIIGIFFFPSTTGTSIAQVGVKTRPVEVDVLVMGLKTSGTDKNLIQEGEKANFIIRNQPSGQINIKSVKRLPKTVTVSQPDGSVKALPDPRPEEAYSSNMLLTLEGKGQITASGPVLGNNKITVSSPIELEGKTYRFGATVTDIRIQD